MRIVPSNSGTKLNAVIQETEFSRAQTFGIPNGRANLLFPGAAHFQSSPIRMEHGMHIHIRHGNFWHSFVDGFPPPVAHASANPAKDLSGLQMSCSMQEQHCPIE
jgi:hypothetical protein